MGKRKKKILTLLSVAMIATMIFVPLVFVKTVVAADPTDWCSTVNGVLVTGTYALYTFEEKSLKFGLSKFGKLIDSTRNVDLEYGDARDPFAVQLVQALTSLSCLRRFG
jgi:hypothetical protein